MPKHARSVVRRQAIIEAALRRFSKQGIQQAAIEDIAAEADASVGSIYHQFKSKGGVAAAVYLEGLRRYQSGMLERLTSSTRAREGVNAIVGFHLDWTTEHEVWARYLLQARNEEFMRAAEKEVRELNKEFARAMGEWMDPLMRSNRLRVLPVDVFLALLLGPCHEYGRGYLRGRSVTPLREAKKLLSDGAWRAVGKDEG